MREERRVEEKEAKLRQEEEEKWKEEQEEHGRKRGDGLKAKREAEKTEEGISYHRRKLMYLVRETAH